MCVDFLNYCNGYYRRHGEETVGSCPPTILGLKTEIHVDRMSYEFCNCKSDRLNSPQTCTIINSFDGICNLSSKKTNFGQIFRNKFDIIVLLVVPHSHHGSSPAPGWGSVPQIPQPPHHGDASVDDMNVYVIAYTGNMITSVHIHCRVYSLWNSMK